jgi:hypothetical protein
MYPIADPLLEVFVVFQYVAGSPMSPLKEVPPTPVTYWLLAG